MSIDVDAAGAVEGVERDTPSTPPRRRAVWTLADQGLSSVSNFAVGVVVAKLAGPAGLGVFTLAYAAWQLLVNQHRALVTDPMAIEGDARGPGATRGAAQGLAAELIVGVAVGLLFVVIGVVLRSFHEHSYGTALLAVAPWLPVLVVQDYWRWIGFMSGQPLKSLFNDMLFDVVEVAAFLVVFLTGAKGAPVIIAAWGSGALAGALVGVRQFRVLPSQHRGFSLARTARSARAFVASGFGLLRRRWKIGRWIAGESVVSWASSQGYIVVAGFVLGPAGLGGLKAAQQLVAGPTMVLVQSAGSLGLPEASRAYAERGWAGMSKVARMVTAVGMIGMGAMTIVMVVAGRWLLTKVYSPQFADLYWVAVMIGIAQTITMSCLGSLLVMKVTRNTKYLLYTTVGTLPVLVIGVAVLSHLYGVQGAAVTTLIAATMAAIGVRWLRYRTRRADSSAPAVAADSSGLPAGDGQQTVAGPSPLPPDLEAL